MPKRPLPGGIDASAARAHQADQNQREDDRDEDRSETAQAVGEEHEHQSASRDERRNRREAARNVSMRHGLVRIASATQPSARIASGAPVTAMIGTGSVSGSSRSRRHSSAPLMSGRR